MSEPLYDVSVMLATPCYVHMHFGSIITDTS